MIRNFHIKSSPLAKGLIKRFMGLSDKIKWTYPANMYKSWQEVAYYAVEATADYTTLVVFCDENDDYDEEHVLLTCKELRKIIEELEVERA